MQHWHAATTRHSYTHLSASYWSPDVCLSLELLWDIQFGPKVGVPTLGCAWRTSGWTPLSKFLNPPLGWRLKKILRWSVQLAEGDLEFWFLSRPIFAHIHAQNSDNLITFITQTRKLTPVCVSLSSLSASDTNGVPFNTMVPWVCGYLQVLSVSLYLECLWYSFWVSRLVVSCLTSVDLITFVAW